MKQVSYTMNEEVFMASTFSPNLPISLLISSFLEYQTEGNQELDDFFAIFHNSCLF